ncbi:hypothetical protein [Endozoicomonas sp. ONNA2]|uniref:hypothetical protein n=1 Tax=Endozoicomonas sp. ONNA2 TaxID=2828741 RepID=UPI002149838E|nr:hypothetical protein [Endozoicomonas sp. ONNA2]
MADLDVSLPYAATCAVCKTKVIENNPKNFRVTGSLHFDYCDRPKTKDPTLSAVERSVHCDPLTLDAIKPLMDEAIKSNNFPAIWQLKSRYGLTLSAAQLKEVLWQALPPSPGRLSDTVCANNKIQLALELITNDDASKTIVSDFLHEVLKKERYVNYILVNRLVESKIPNKTALKEAFDYLVSEGRFDDAKAMKDQYEFSLNFSQLKEQLQKTYDDEMSQTVQSILSLYNKDDGACQFTLCYILKTVATQPQDVSPKLLDQSSRRFFVNYMGFISTLLSHGVMNQTAVDAAMSKAVSTISREGLEWAGELKARHQATIDPAKLKEAIVKAIDQNKRSLLELILPFFSSEQDTKAANIMILEKLASKSNQYFQDVYRFAKEACQEQLASSRCWSQKAVDTLIKRAIDNDDIHWAIELNNDYRAYLDIETLASKILKEVDSVKAKRICNTACLDNLRGSLSLAKPDDPALPDTIQTITAQIINMELFPLKQAVVEMLVDFQGSL